MWNSITLFRLNSTRTRGRNGNLTRLFRINQLSLKFLAFLGFFFNSLPVFLDYNCFSSAALPVLLYNRFTAHVFYSGFNFIYLGSSTLFVQHLILAIFIIYSTVPIFLLLELIFFHSFRKIIQFSIFTVSLITSILPSLL